MRAKIEAELDKSQRREPGERIDPVAEERKLLEFLVKFSGTPNPATSALAEEMENALKACGYVVRRVKIKALSRGLVGASASYGKIPFEVGLSFDSFLNVPYIPGSTIKGAVRSGVYEILLRSGRQEADADQICGRLFGDRGSIGLIGFTDAYPVKAGVKEYLLYPDVMTPHYTDDTKNELEVRPNPVTFLTIAPSTTFQFYMFYRKGRGERLLRVGTGLDADLAENPVAEISSLGVVDMGLLYSFYRGVGAKTSVGYSRFEVVEYTKV
ncbi:MAG: type III-B CRISPR module RAMP protein Cmr6 [Candidatus Caldarchaeum sp.]